MEKLIVFIGMLIGTLASALGVVQLKIGSKKFNLDFTLKGIIAIIKNFRIMIGLVFYLLATTIFILLLRNTELSFLYPLTSLTYIYVTILSYYILKEEINRYKVLGVMLIVLGLIFIAISAI